MSVLCLICKEKLISYSPGGLNGSLLEQLVENVVISTSCGHLYHYECLQSWFRTQKIKNQNGPGIGTENGNICPSCLTRVKEEDNRRIYLLEDHVEALEKAKLLERQENLEIYCHQLEIQLHQLQRENDVMVNTILTPPTSPLEDYDTIVKNDRVKWMRKDEEPLTGVVLSIFKKEGKLCAKIRLDRKIRTTQRSNRLFSSFRTDKKQEVTIPFEEIVLEKGVNANKSPSSTNSSSTAYNMNSGLFNNNMSAYGKSLSSTNIYPMYNNTSNSSISMRNSTLSLPGESKSLFGIRESMHESTASINAENEDNYVNNHVTSTDHASPTRPTLNRSVSYSPGFPVGSSTSKNENRFSHPGSSSVSSSNASLDQQRDYVVITPPWMRNKPQPKQVDSRGSPPDYKNKHVTFADDHAVSKFTFSTSSNNAGTSLEKVPESGESLSSINSDTPYVNFPSSVVFHEKRDAPIQSKVAGPTPPPRPIISLPSNSDNQNSQELGTTDDGHEFNFNPSPVPLTPEDDEGKEIAPSNVPIVSDAPENSGSISEVFEDELDDTLALNNDNCFGVTLLSLLYESNGFDQQMLMYSAQDNEFCRTVKWIIREKFAVPLRQSNSVHPDFAYLLKESLAHLCSGTLDVEELLTILFEFTYKMTPFINYSLDMCDYLHQFFIDFTDKSKIRSVLDLFEKSLQLQDNLKLEDIPSPSLILQMPHSSNDGVIHYDAIIPNLTMVIDHLIDKKDSKNYVQKCYCDHSATLECKKCSEVHGSGAVLFCEECKDLLEGLHMKTDHELEMTPIPPSPSLTLSLSALICLKDNQYSVFLKDGRDTYSPWVYVNGVVNGKLQIKELSGFGYWLESLLDGEKQVNLQEIPVLLQKALKYCRVLFYVPERPSSSEV